MHRRNRRHHPDKRVGEHARKLAHKWRSANGHRRRRGRPPSPDSSRSVGTIACVPFDSTPDALDVQRATWRRLGPEGRVRVALELSEDVRRVALAGERTRHPDWSRAELRMALAARIYDEQLRGPAART